MTAATAAPVKPRKTRERITLPWALNTDGVARFMKEWKDARDGSDFKDKHNLTLDQWHKCQTLAQKLRGKGIKMKVMRLTNGGLDDVDFNVLKTHAKNLGML